MWLEYKQSELKVIFLILLLLLIAVGSVQINVASMKTEDESKINRFINRSFKLFSLSRQYRLQAKTTKTIKQLISLP